MRYLVLFFLFVNLFAFEVEFNEKQSVEIFPNQEAILLVTHKPIQINYSPKVYTNKGIVLLNYNSADEFVRDDLYFNGEVKNVKIAKFNIDKVRNQMIMKLNRYYKNCTLKKIFFDNSNYKNIYFKPTIIHIQAKVTLDCH